MELKFPLLYLLVAVCLLLNPAVARCEGYPLKSEISTGVQTVEEGQVFKVIGKVMNVGSKPLRLEIFDIFFLNWKVDNRRIPLVAYSVRKNVPHAIVLNPRQEYSQEVYLFPVSINGANKETFRLKFTAYDSSGSSKPIESEWSNAITIEVRDSSIKLEIAVDKKDVRGGEEFSIRAKIINVGKEVLELEDWEKAAWWQWHIDNAPVDLLLVPSRFPENYPPPKKVVLKPRGFYEVDLPATMRRKPDTNTVRFKIGYVPVRWSAESLRLRNNRGDLFKKFSVENSPLWSKYMVLRVNPAPTVPNTGK